MTQKQLQDFFNSRPSVSKEGIAKEAGITPRLLVYILSGSRSITEKTEQKLLPVLKKYGWKIN